MSKLIFYSLFVFLFFNCKKKNDIVTTPPPVSVIDLATTQQTIRGFGGATVWIGALTDGEMSTLFDNSNDNQLGFTILRVRIDPAGSSSWGTELSNAQKAKARGAIVIASPWSPPASMKTNNNIVGGSLKASSYLAYAQYLKSFSDYMTTGGADLYGISIQNEPDIPVTYESCNWTAGEMTDFIKTNGSDIGSTRLIAAESFNFRQSYTDSILNDGVAASKLSIIGGHIYGSGLAKYNNAINKGKEVWMTEHLDTNTTWNAVIATAKEIHDCMVTANYNAYLWWYLKRFYGPVDANSQPTKRGFVMAQFSKYIRPGYQRVDASNPDANVYVSAYKGNGKTVIVALNLNSTVDKIQFTVNGGTAPAAFTPHVTSASKNLSAEAAVNVSGNGFTYDLPASSVTTFVSN